MKKITKEMCTVFIKDYYKSNHIVLFILSIFAVIAVGFFTKNVIIAAIVAALALLAILFIIKVKTKKIENLNWEDFYLVEDVIIGCQKKISTKASGGSGHNYIYTFRDNGKYTIHKSAHPTVEIPLHKEKNIDHLSVESLCIESREQGDMYYLLIAKKRNFPKLLNAFPNIILKSHKRILITLMANIIAKNNGIFFVNTSQKPSRTKFGKVFTFSLFTLHFSLISRARNFLKVISNSE